MKLKWDLWFRAAKWIGTGLTAIALTWMACAQAISTTMVHGTVHLADGTPGSGSLQLSWPAFTTADSHAVAAGRTTVSIGAGGNISVNLAPNLGSTPAGLYYTAVYHLNDGTTSTEYWVVPPADQVGIAQVRAQVMPAAQAVQAVSKAYVDQAIQSINQGSLTSTGGALTGPLYLNGDPTQPLQAADKHYVDSALAQAVPLTGATMTGPLTLTNHADTEIDYTLEPGLTSSQKGAFTYNDWNGTGQWSMAKDANNNWALNSATSGLDSFKAYQNTNGGDTYVNATNPSGAVRVNYENGAGAAFNVYGGSSNNLYASFSGTTSIKFPGLATAGGHNCLQIGADGSMSNTGAPCGSGSGTVGNGDAGQIAYYTGTGTAIGGTNTVPISSGGTGASTAMGALMALSAASLATQTPQSFSGPLNAPSINTSVNSQINVMAPPYNAKGDCVTDDHDSIQAAMNAAYASNPPAQVFFPRSPGGCYLTSTLNWLGVSLDGVASGAGYAVASMPSQLRSKPGQDLFRVSDANDVARPNPLYAFTVSNLDLVVDDSIDVSGNYPNRKPGRTTQDGSMTAGSAVLTSSSTNDPFSQSDIGQAITVAGAGPGGATLSTTIASYQTPNSVTLAATASTTVTNAVVYVSLAGLSATQTIGNCALAWDNRDANSANYRTVLGGTPGLFYSVFRDVSVRSLSANAQNNSCGFFLQGAGVPYGTVFDNVNIERLTFGFVEGLYTVNVTAGGEGGDYNTWSQGKWDSVFPFIYYNGGLNTIEKIQIASQHGLHILNANTGVEYLANNWYISVPEIEQSTGVTFRLQGRNHTVVNTQLSDNNGHGFWDASYSRCIGCFAIGNMQVNGSVNDITLDDGIDALTLTNNGIDNKIRGGRMWNPYKGAQPSRQTLMAPARLNPVGAKTPDFIMHGLASTPYSNDLDLWYWPQDMHTYGTGGTGVVTADNNSESGYNIAIANNSGIDYMTSFNGTAQAGGWAIGGNMGYVPAAKVNVYVRLKCPGGAQNIAVTANVVIQQPSTNNSVGALSSFPCTTSYTTAAIPADFSSWTGWTPGLSFNVTTGVVDVAWVAFRPWDADELVNGTVYAQNLNAPLYGKNLAGSGPAIPTGPNTTTAGHAMCAVDGTGTLGDCSGGTSNVVLGNTGTYSDVEISPGRTVYGTDGSNHGLFSLTNNQTAPQWSNNFIYPFQLTDLNATASGKWLAALSGQAGVWSNVGAGAPTDWYQNSAKISSGGGGWVTLQASGGGSYAVNLPSQAGTLALVPLSGTTGSIGGSAMATGQCVSETVTVNGATTGMVAVASPITYPGDGMAWRSYVSSANTVTVKVCAEVPGTPTASTYNVRVIQ
jgi:hypothetical protein